jgi:hypothetical protein
MLSLNPAHESFWGEVVRDTFWGAHSTEQELSGHHLQMTGRFHLVTRQPFLVAGDEVLFSFGVRKTSKPLHCVQFGFQLSQKTVLRRGTTTTLLATSASRCCWHPVRVGASALVVRVF